tara:strand:+ start:55 stop:294 length:240 start_codon:yes stop_codon:yes gene_type:complete
MRNIWVLLQLAGLLLIVFSLAGGFYVFEFLDGLTRIIISIFMITLSIGGIFLILFGGIKYRQESRKIKEQGKSTSNPLL